MLFRSYLTKTEYSEVRLISEETAYATAKVFAKKISPKFSLCSQDTNTTIKFSDGGDGYSFVFPRIVNGLQYLDNGIVVWVNAISGKVSSYVCKWREGSFPDATQISVENAADELFTRVGFSLQYVAIAKSGVLQPKYASDVETRLVYSFIPGKPLYVDSKNGRLCYSDGRAFADDLDKKYNDIEGHPSKKYIETLLSSGILKRADKFRPDESITQRDYLQWICSAVKQYEPEDDETLYDDLYYYNVISEDEMDAAAELTFEQAIRFLIRILGFTDVAELEDTYVTAFFDEATIDPEYIGYAAISQGLGIVRGNAFTPKRIVTRATAAEIIYNLVAPKSIKD